jgi:hypothetical protein
MVSGISLRLGTRPDLPAIAAFLPPLGGGRFRLRHPQTVSVVDFYRWKYFENPYGETVIGIAGESDTIASMASALPKRVQVGGSVHFAYELGDFLTAEKFRKRGLFTQVIELLCEECARRGASFVYVRPNSVSFPILAERSSFTEAAQIQPRRYVRMSSALSRKTGLPARLLQLTGVDALVSHLAAGGHGGGVEVEPLRRFGPDTDTFWERVRREYSFLLSRESSYLNWRYIDSATPFEAWVALRRETVAGFLVGSMAASAPEAFIADLLTSAGDDDAARALVRTALDRFHRGGARTVSTWALLRDRDSAPARILPRACGFRDGGPMHFAIRPLASSFSLQALPTARWHFTQGDFDGF